MTNLEDEKKSKVIIVLDDQVDKSQVKKFNNLNFIIKNTHTCYKGDRKTFHKWGYGCNKCPACLLRSKGWKKFVKDD